MGAFIGYADVGVWANNAERNAFLDWFAENRCVTGDSLWEYCKFEGHRWNGYCIDLEDLVPKGVHLSLTDEEYSNAAKTFWPHVAQLLGIINSITTGEWQIRVDSKASVNWRRPKC